jgi:bleomycin hydrolase
MVLPAQPLTDALKKEIDQRGHPSSIGQFAAVRHLSPINQDTTSSCWSFASISFIESEMMRLGLDSVRLAVMYPVYSIFLEKMKQFVETHGKSRFAPGDLFFGVLETVQKYGLVPMSAYRGSTCEWDTRNHTALYAELDSLTHRLKAAAQWNEEDALVQTRQILDKHLGAPPAEFVYRGKKYSPVSFAKEIVRLPWDNYVRVMSFQYAPFYANAVLKVPDNWMNDSSFYNVPLDVWYQSMKDGLAAGYSFAFDADISEPGYRLGSGTVIVPQYDIPMNAITQEAREFRFSTGATVDDHLMQAIGYTRVNGADWFLVKDSWRTAYQSEHPGYLFIDESYMKLKVLAYMVHRDAIPGLWKK